MKKFTKEVKIALVSIFSLFLLYYGINYLKGVNLLKPANYYYLVLHNISGLTVSSPVYVDGFKAGLVRSFEYEYEHPGNIIVEISMDKKMKIAEGSTALYKGDLLGTAAIELHLNLEGTQFHQPGDTLPTTQTRNLMNTFEYELMPKLTQVMSRLDTVLTGLQKVVANPALNQSIENIAFTTNELNKSSQNLSKIMNSDVPVIVTNLKQVSGDFSTVSSNLKKVDYAAVMSSADSTLSNLKSLTRQLNQPDNTMGLLLRDRVLYDSLSASASSANRLLIDLKAHPKRYVHFSIFGKK
ncbi:MAG: MlaD family protein [Bacteroidales bacterium]